MRRLPRTLLIVVPLIVGGIIAAWWAWSAGGASLATGLAQARLQWVVVALGLTAIWLFARFIRWQFLLRRVGVRLPIRPTLKVYVAGLPGTATPAYVGEAVRSLFLKRRFGVPVRISLAAWVLERLYDVAALGLVALGTGLALRSSVAMRVGVAFVLLAVLMAALLWPVAKRVGIAPGALAVIRSAGTVLPSLVMSLGAWLVAALLVSVAAAGFGLFVSPVESLRIFSTSTLLGAVTLLPAGAGATGSLAILELGRLGMALESAVLVISLMRITSTGASLLVGSLFLWRELRSLRTVEVSEAGAAASEVGDAAAHFDIIAEQYNAQWSPHVWDLLIGRKLGFIAEALPEPPVRAGIGLDLGCGLGLQAAELRGRGYNVIGLDPSVGLLGVGKSKGVDSVVVAGSALSLPFGESSLDFVYTIGVLHHLDGRDAQRVALKEIARVLKPGGRLLVHESNPRNPLFRFYMGYLFPILKSIDEGTEWWIDPRYWEPGGMLAGGSNGGGKEGDGLRLRDVRYFTFLPDFTPRVFMKPALVVERFLERGPTRTYSAHYMAILEKPGRVHSSDGPNLEGEGEGEGEGKVSRRGVA